MSKPILVIRIETQPNSEMVERTEKTIYDYHILWVYGPEYIQPEFEVRSVQNVTEETMDELQNKILLLYKH